MQSLETGQTEGVDTDPTRAWEAEAACRTTPLLFVTDVKHETAAERYVREEGAKGVCRSCVVSDECLAFAMRVREPLGIWGGRTEAERRALASD